MKDTALAVRDFRRLLSGSLVSYVCQWVQQATLGWVVYDITGSGTLLGAVLGMRAVPMLLVSPIAGVAADRYDLRTLMLASQITSALVSAAFGAILALGWVQTWHLFAFVLFSGASAVLDRPARVSTMFAIVPRNLMMNAAGINAVAMSLARIAGPALAGYLIAWFGAAGNFFIQGALYAVSAVLGLFVAYPRRAKTARQTSAWSDLAEGLRYAANEPDTRLLLTFSVMMFVLLVPLWGTAVPVFAKDVFEAGPEGLGMLLTAGGAGATLGSLTASKLQRVDRQGRVLIVALLLNCAALAGLAASPTLTLAALFLFFAGGAEMVIATGNQVMLQMIAPDRMRGRVTSLLALCPIAISVGALMAGVLVDLTGPRGATALLAAATAVVFLALYARSPRLRNLRLRGRDRR